MRPFVLAAWILAIVLALAGLAQEAFGLEGFACQHTRQCSHRELCVAESPTSTWGRCMTLTVLP